MDPKSSQHGCTGSCECEGLVPWRAALWLRTDSTSLSRLLAFGIDARLLRVMCSDVASRRIPGLVPLASAPPLVESRDLRQ